MKRQHLAVLFVLGLGMACAAHAQEAVPDDTTDNHNAAAPFSSVTFANTNLSQPGDIGTLSTSSDILTSPVLAMPLSAAAPEASPSPAPAPTPAPAPDPRFVYGGRDDYRWQIGVGVDWLRFRSSLFNASAVGVDSSVTYFTNEWFGVEGNVATGFAPEIYDREHVKLLVYGAGPKIAIREKKWEPWVHAIVGGAHEQPQTAGNSRNAFAAEAGGGADYRFNPRFSGRLEADWIHTGFFSQSQNNFKLMGGIVFHF